MNHDIVEQARTGRTLWLVRHGESTWNRLGLAQGHRDEAELTSRGIRQAWAVAGQLRGHQIGALYASDLRRAAQTVAPLASVLQLPVTLDARLRERSLGVLEGVAADKVGAQASGLAGGQVISPDARPEAGESIRDLYGRAAAFLDELAAQVADGDVPPGDIVVVAHGGTLRVLHAHVRGIAVEDMEWAPLQNCTIIRITSWAGSSPVPGRGGSTGEPDGAVAAPVGG